MWARLERLRLGRLLCALSVMLAFADGAAAAEIKVTLLGTDTPTPRLSAFSASTLIGRDLMSFVVSDKVEAFGPDSQPLTPQVSAQ